MKGLSFEIRAYGIDETERDLGGVSSRLKNLTPAFEQSMRHIEEGEVNLFARLRGKYVDTSATRDSLTQPHANGAVRLAHHDELEFGTSIFYARFLRAKGKSAVLVLRPDTKKKTAQTILRYATGTRGEIGRRKGGRFGLGDGP